LNYFYLIYVSAAVYFIFAVIGVLSKPVKRKKRLWLPGYEIIYADSNTRKKLPKGGGLSGKLLVSEAHGLRGKPDYIYKKGNKIVPVELKSATLEKRGAREGDIMQLAAYFLIIGDVYKLKPRYGYLVYGDAVFKIKNTRGLNKNLRNVTGEMRRMLVTGNGRANAGFVNCKHCICRGTVCEHCE